MTSAEVPSAATQEIAICISFPAVVPYSERYFLLFMMMPPNLERMLRLADEFFDVKSDPTQLAVTREVMDRLRALHPFSLNEESTIEGPIAWILVIPTTTNVMRSFLDGFIGEQELLAKTLPGQTYDSIYLCSALVLPEFREMGIALRLTVESVNKICNDHPITRLFFWPFSEEGDRLASKVAEACNLPLLRRSR